MPDTPDPDTWRASTVPPGCKVEVGDVGGMGVHVNEPMPVRLMIERDTVYRMYHNLLDAVREYFEAWDGMRGDGLHSVEIWKRRHIEREAALRRLVGMEARDE